MAIGEKSPAIDGDVLADLEAISRTKGIVRDPELYRRITDALTGYGGKPSRSSVSRRSGPRSSVRCMTNEVRDRRLNGIPMGGSRAPLPQGDPAPGRLPRPC